MKSISRPNRVISSDTQYSRQANLFLLALWDCLGIQKVKIPIWLFKSTLPLELVITLTDTFPTSARMAHKESAKRLQHTLYWLHPTNKQEFLSHTFLTGMKPT